MPNKFGAGCNCCGCEDKLVFQDTGETEELIEYAGQPASWEYFYKAGWGNPPATGPMDPGHTIRVKDGEVGTKYQWQTIPIPNKKNLRVIVAATIDFTDVEDLHTIGIFIGGVARIFYSGASNRVFLQWPIDAEGNSFGDGITNQMDMNFAGIFNPNMRIIADVDWTGDRTFFVGIGGFVHSGFAPYSYAGVVPNGHIGPFGAAPPLVGLNPPTVNVGMFGTARNALDNFKIYKSQTGNNRCQDCELCDQAHIVKAYDLSVPEFAQDGDKCSACAALAGEWILRYELFWNFRTYTARCGWHTIEEISAGCPEDIFESPPAVAWHLHASTGIWTLEATGNRNVIRYYCQREDFVCGEAAEFYLDTTFKPCSVFVNCCGNPPATLTLIPRAEGP